MGAGLISFLPLIIKGIGDTITLLGSSGGPDFPNAPKMARLPVAQAKAQMEAYEATRMQASIDAWKAKFPDLYKGGQFMVDDIRKQQQGYLGGNVAADMAKSGLGPVHEGIDQYRLSQDIGLSPITLSQRTSQAVTRQMAQNPEWTNQISGGTLATMMANNYRNQNAFGQFLGAQQTAMYAAGQAGSAYNTQALLAGLTGGAGLGAQIYNRNQSPYNPLSPVGQGTLAPPPYQQQYPPSQAMGYGAQPSTMWNFPQNTYMNQGPWGMTGASPYGSFGGSGYGGTYGNTWDPNQMNITGPLTGTSPIGNYGI